MILVSWCPIRADLAHPISTCWTVLHNLLCFLLPMHVAGLKREWIIGQHLNKLRGPRDELAGFLLTLVVIWVVLFH